jgi:hypothetical protein
VAVLARAVELEPPGAPPGPPPGAPPLAGEPEAATPVVVAVVLPFVVDVAAVVVPVAAAVEAGVALPLQPAAMTRLIAMVSRTPVRRVRGCRVSVESFIVSSCDGCGRG